MTDIKRRLCRLQEKVGGTDEEERERMQSVEKLVHDYLKRVEERQRQRAEKEKAEKLGSLKPLLGDTVH